LVRNGQFLSVGHTLIASYLRYGFIGNPTINIVVTPQVGEKELSYSAVTDWIADKLKLEFQVRLFQTCLFF
jgi:hypothetical protein